MLLSGGIDSATALAATKKVSRVRALTVEYHGIASAELRAARAIGDWAGVHEHRFVRLPDLREAADIAGAEFPGLPPTYIPARNAIFYSVAASWAEETGASTIVGGHNLDDSRVFEDAGSGFFGALQDALRAGSPSLRKKHFAIERPLRRLHKEEVIALASASGVPFELTWSCHRDGVRHCWECPGCISRRECFIKAGVRDPLSAGKQTKIT